MSFFIDEWLSPVGNLLIKATNEGLLSICHGELFSDEVINPNAITAQTKNFLCAYFEGQSVELNTLPIHWHGTSFQNTVWQTLLQIPFGETRYYEQIALQVRGNKNARAIGQAIGKNPILILIPCHRVIGKNGTLTGFSAGIEVKKWLLEFEKRSSEKQK